MIFLTVHNLTGRVAQGAKACVRLFWTDLIADNNTHCKPAKEGNSPRGSCIRRLPVLPNTAPDIPAVPHAIKMNLFDSLVRRVCSLLMSFP